LEDIKGLGRFRSDFNNPRLNLRDFIKYKSDFDLAFAFCKLFFPDFVQAEGCVILAEAYDPVTFQDWKHRLHGRTQDLETTLNHTHIYDLFSESEENEDVSLEICDEIAKHIAKSWTNALKEAFPDKKFTVTLSTEPDDYGPTITFCQSSSETCESGQFQDR